jgi:hypothetical protein
MLEAGLQESGYLIQHSEDRRKFSRSCDRQSQLESSPLCGSVYPVAMCIRYADRLDAIVLSGQREDNVGGCSASGCCVTQHHPSFISNPNCVQWNQLPSVVLNPFSNESAFMRTRRRCPGMLDTDLFSGEVLRIVPVSTANFTTLHCEVSCCGSTLLEVPVCYSL